VRGKRSAWFARRVAEAIGIRSDFEGDQQDHLSRSILWLQVGEEKVRPEVVGEQRRYCVRSHAAGKARAAPSQAAARDRGCRYGFSGVNAHPAGPGW
jgi:hypothetical protein